MKFIIFALLFFSLNSHAHTLCGKIFDQLAQGTFFRKPPEKKNPNQKIQIIQQAGRPNKRTELKNILNQYANDSSVKVQLAIARSARHLKEQDGIYVLSRSISTMNGRQLDSLLRQEWIQSIAESASALNGKKAGNILKNLYNQTKSPQEETVVIENIGLLNKPLQAEITLPLIRKGMSETTAQAIIENTKYLKNNEGGKILSVLYGMNENTLTIQQKLEMIHIAKKMQNIYLTQLLLQTAQDSNYLVKQATAQNAVYLKDKKQALRVLFGVSKDINLPSDIKITAIKSIRYLRLKNLEHYKKGVDILSFLFQGELTPSLNQMIVKTAYSFGENGRRFIQNFLNSEKWKNLPKEQRQTVFQIIGEIKGEDRVHLLSFLAFDSNIEIKRDVFHSVNRFLTKIEKKIPNFKSILFNPVLILAVDAEKSINRTLSASEMRALYKAYSTKWPDETPLFSYQKNFLMSKKIQILKDAGFSKEERRILVEKEIINSAYLEQKESINKKIVNIVYKKVINSVNVFPFLEESALREKGHQTIYTQELDHAIHLIHLGKKLRAKNVHPQRTHVKDFEKFTKEHIEFIKNSLLSQDQKLDTQLQILEQLEQKVNRQIKNRKVTYAWYLKVNYYLSSLASGNYFEFQSLDDLEILFFENSSYFYELALSQFPDKIFLPTIKRIGIMGFNRSFTEGINFIGLIGEKTYADGRELTPEKFFQHDIEHGNSISNFVFSKNNLMNQWKKIYPQFMNRLKNLPPEKREMAEMIYFMIAHEDLLINSLNGAVYNTINAKHLKSEIKERRIKRFLAKDDLAFFLPEEIKGSKEKIIDYLNQSVGVFMEAVKTN